MGTSTQEGFGSSFMDDELRPGESRTNHWSILSRVGKKIIKAWLTEFVYEDGTKWKSINK